MLIRNARIYGHGLADVRFSEKITEIGTLTPRSGERHIDANGGCLLPGLHDHHIHLASLAARRASLDCSPPRIADAEGLKAALGQTGNGWLRAVGFCETILGGMLPDTAFLDEAAPHRPVRLQHRSGRMWFLNSPAIEMLLAMASPPPGLETKDGKWTGRLFDEDRWLRDTLAGSPPDLGDVSRDLARRGITGVTDMSPANDAAMARHLTCEIEQGKLRQSLVLAGKQELSDMNAGLWRTGPRKIHLHENALPPFEEAVEWIRSAHRSGRGVAVHCVTEVELVFTLALFEDARSNGQDRIEHLSIAAPSQIETMHELGIAACVQPHFIFEHGDRYLAEVEARHIPDLYRLRSLSEAGLTMAAGSDAPHGSTDPWAAMEAATKRLTQNGDTIGANEALTPEEALALYLADPLDLGRKRCIVPGQPADLCLLSRPWGAVRTDLGKTQPCLTISGGQIIHEHIDKPPFQREPRAHAAA